MSSSTKQRKTTIGGGGGGGGGGAGKKLNSILNRTLSDSILDRRSFSASHSFNNSFYLNPKRDYALSRKNR
jgi:hypothetical protein